MTSTQTKIMTEETTAERDLIRGDFSAEDAKDILNHIIAKKVEFHELRNFSHEIRFGEKEENSVARCSELKAAKKAFNLLIEKAGKEGKSLRINSTITVEVL